MVLRAPDGRWTDRLRARLLGPSQAAVVVVAPTLLLGRQVGLVANVSIWLLVGLLVGAQLSTAVAYALWPDAVSGWRLYARAGVQLLATSVVIYAIGWGPTLAVGLMFGVADNIQASGSKATLPCIVWSVVGLGAGELAIALGWSPTLVSQPLVHGLAALAALGLAFTIVLLGRSTGAKEQAEADLRRSDERFKALVQHASDVIMVVDHAGTLRYVSPAFERLLGYAAPHAIGTQAMALAHPDDVDLARRAIGEVQDATGAAAAARVEVRLRERDGAWRWFDASVMNLLADPGVAGVVVNLRDISDRRRAQDELAEAEARFRGAFEDAPIGMGLANRHGHLFRVNRALADMLGYEPSELQGMDVADITHPDDREATQRQMADLLAGEIPSYQIEKRYLRRDGHVLWVCLSVSLVQDADGEPAYTIGQVEDISERKATAERLAHAAIHDPLTGLPNRVLFVDRLARALVRARRHDTKVGVIFLDLDRFKVVNDSLGHATGDELLKAISERLLGALRPEDTVARFGGDEFVVLCEDITDDTTVRQVAQRIEATISRPTVISRREIFVTASIGVVVSGAKAASPETLLRDADAAMYGAKGQGRARIECFDRQTHQRSVEALELEADLHRVVERGELRVHYQPIVDLVTGRVSGFEALIRWMHPTRGLVDPHEFITLAEDTGLIVPIGAWILEEACRQAAHWQSQRRSAGAPLTVSVNVAPRQLSEPSLAEQCGQILDATGIDPQTVWLEVTESALSHAETSIKALQSLRDLGVHLSVDDFGTGYSSLAHLKAFPVEALKIDQGFVGGLGTDPSDTTIVGAVVGLAHSMGLAAIAEGLEEPSQLAELRTLGCDYAQGYLFGAPQPASALGDHPADDLTAWHTAVD
jgi:diguanylate cyclase (GGDEF)-like protein/PAS domain S-box-containing protein